MSVESMPAFVVVKKEKGDTRFIIKKKEL